MSTELPNDDELRDHLVALTDPHNLMGSIHVRMNHSGDVEALASVRHALADLESRSQQGHTHICADGREAVQRLLETAQETLIRIVIEQTRKIAECTCEECRARVAHLN